MEHGMERTVWQTEVGMAEKTALVLLNMGGPDSLESVQPFLRNLFSDRELIRLPGGFDAATLCQPDVTLAW